MKTTCDLFEAHGYLIAEPVLSSDALDELERELPIVSNAGTRTLLQKSAFRALAARLRAHERLSDYLGNLVAIEGIFFHKHRDRNWSLMPHWDSVIPTAGDGPCKPAGEKERMACAHAPLDFMRQCVAVRLALDEVPEGDIQVEVGTHKTSDRQPATTLVVPRGGAVLMRPCLIHSSAKLTASLERRVVHLLYAPRELPDGYRWYHAA